MSEIGTCLNLNVCVFSFQTHEVSDIAKGALNQNKNFSFQTHFDQIFFYKWNILFGFQTPYVPENGILKCLDFNQQVQFFRLLILNIYCSLL